MQDSHDQWVWPCPAPPLSDNSWYDDTLPTDVVDVQIDQHLSQAAGTGALQLGVHVFRRVPSIGFQLLGASLLCASFMGTAVGMQSAQAPMLVYVWRSQLALMLCVPWLCTTVYYHRGAIDALWEPRMLLSIILAGARRATSAVLDVVKSRVRRATSTVLHVVTICGWLSRETRNFYCATWGQVSREMRHFCCTVCGLPWRCVQVALHSLAPSGIGDDPVSHLAVHTVPLCIG